MAELAVVSLLTTTGSVKVLTWIESCIMRKLALIALVARLRQIELAELARVQVHLGPILVERRDQTRSTHLLLKWTLATAVGLVLGRILLHHRIGQI